MYVDTNTGITMEQIAEISREIEGILDLENAIAGRYRLDVSSPGVDKPLKFLKQYPKHIKRNFEVSYKSGEETKKILGKLISVEEENLTFLCKNVGEVKVKFNNIKKAKVTVSFS